MRLLIVDDSKEFRKILIKVLLRKSSQLEMLEASNITDGYNKFKNENPDLVIVDVYFPERNGFELLERINDDENTSVAMMSSFPNDAIAKRSYEFGADAFFDKTKDYSKLIEYIINEEKKLK